MLEAKKSDCVIWGGYAKGNTGDEICLAAALARTQRECGDRIVVLSHDPEMTARLFPGATVVPYVQPSWRKLGRWEEMLRKIRRLGGLPPRRDLCEEMDCDPSLEWVRCLVNAKRLYLAGGGYLADLFPLELVLPPIQLALQLKIPVATAPIGIGPFSSRLWADTVAHALQPASVRVRDEESLDFCRRRGLSAVLEPDDAFALVKNWPAPLPAGPQKIRSRKIGICIFSQYGQTADWNFSEWWITVLRGLKAQHPDCELEGFCFHTSPQAEFRDMQHLFKEAGLPVSSVLPPMWDWRPAVENIHNYDFIIATRFHAIVAANAFQIPNIAIASGSYYWAKMKTATVGYENFSSVVNPKELAPAALLDLCRRRQAGN